MNKYLEGFKKRAGVSIVFCQLIIIMFQLANLNKQRVIVCEPDQYQQRIICIEQ